MHNHLPGRTELNDEYDDLVEEYLGCGDHDERVRCAHRMEEIIEEEACQDRIGTRQPTDVPKPLTPRLSGAHGAGPVTA